MKIGLGIGIPFIRNYISSLFDPSKLFTGSTNGVWYDPSDITTLYRDAAGTLPVTAVEQPVGLMLDKSKNAVGTNGAKRVNLLTYTEQFDNGTIWEKSGSSNLPVVTADYATGPIQGTLADRVQLVRTTSGGDYCQLGQAFTATVGTTYTLSVWMRSLSGSAVVDMGYWNSAYGNYKPTVTTDWQRFSFTFTASGTISRFGPLLYQTTGTSVSADLLIYGAQLEVGSTATAYQKITDTWYNTLPGNHAFNSSGNSANFPVLSARVNLLTKTEDFSDAVWNATSGNVTVSSGKIIPNATSGNHYVSQGVATSGITHTITVRAKQAGYTWLKLVAFDRYANFDLANGVVGANYSGVSRSIVAAGDGSYVCTFTFTSTSSASNQGCIIKVGTADNANWDSANYSGNGIDGIQIYYADLRVANDALNQPAYQRVNTSSDYDTVGFKPYLRFNGTNQWLQTNSIDFTYGDKMFVSAGVRKLVNSTASMLLELSANINSNNGSFYITAPESGSTDKFLSKGTQSSVPGYATTASVTNVISGIGDISGDQAILRVNGTQVAISTTDQGTGNFGNYPLYIGARAGSSLWFNGRLYGMVIAGKQASAAEIENTENYLEVKTFGKDMQYVYSDPLLTAASEQITTAGGEDIYLTVTYQ